MANVNGVNATLIQASPSYMAGVGEQGGTVRVIFDKYTVTAALALNDTLQMGGKIPVGARCIDAMIKTADLGTVGTLDLGWLVSDDAVEAASQTGFINALDVHTAAIVKTSHENSAAPAGIGKKFLSPVQPVITASAATDATSGDILMWIWYVID